ncbi:hypothetical protein [Staphylococcus succinus]|uniref:hypothetical protein n=1 Tax=Staphylococcus succinus TaxID=61015 RepID=UPI001C03D0DC|nr:hypothetical protein [Staphylococcus succinus]MBU0439059.1 hypothetical protein [Staphylococcus succinus]
MNKETVPSHVVTAWFDIMVSCGAIPKEELRGKIHSQIDHAGQNRDITLIKESEKPDLTFP